MAKKAKRPSWFKLWLHHKPLIDAVSDEVAGRVIKAAMHYFATGEMIQLDQFEAVVFASLRADIDEANSDYRRDVENGRKGGRPKSADELKPPVTEGNPPLPKVTEGEREGDGDGEGDRDGDGERKCIKADKPPTRHRFSPPTVDEVKAYCLEHGYTVDAGRFVDYYESNGWMVGKNKMKDWKAAVRSWSRKENSNHGKTESQHKWSVGTVV